MKQITQHLFQLFTYIVLATTLVACSGSGGDPDAPRNPKADLASLEINIANNTLVKNFKPDILDYTTTVNFQTGSIKIIPIVSPDSLSSVEITTPTDTLTVNSGSYSSPITLAEGSNLITLVVKAANGSIVREYTVDITRLAVSTFPNTARLTATIEQNNDAFGAQISLSGNTLAIGVPSTLATEAGSVYIFERNNNGFWIHKTTIIPSNAENGDKFGSSVSVSGDTLIIGAPFEDSKAIWVDGVDGDKFDEDIIVDSNGDPILNPDGSISKGNIGAAYIYTRDAGTSTWTEQAYLKPFSTVKNIHRNIKFGSAVAIDGDTAAVSAEFEKSNATGVDGNTDDRSLVKAGAVYIFTRSNGIWSRQAYIKASNTDADDRFGGSIALSGDTLAVGARFEDSNTKGIYGNSTNNSANKSGAVYVFSRVGAIWLEEAYIKASNTDAEDQFGISVDIDGDTLAVGAANEGSYAAGVATNVPGAEDDNSIGRSGAVYIYKRDAGIWSHEAYLKSANPDKAGLFGWSVALSGDIVAVGTTGEESRAGTVNYFSRSGTEWIQHDPLRTSNTTNFGHSVALDGSILAASSKEENSKADAVYVME